MLERGKAYIVKAGTIILVCNTIVQIMQSFNWQFRLVEEGAEGTSILASIAHPFAILFIPLGFGVWQLAAAAVTGFIAKENVVGTLAVVYGITNLIDTDELALVGSGNEVATVMGLTKVAALAYLMFNLYTPPCFAALGAMNSEMKSGKWLLGGICLQLATGYTVAFGVYQIGTLITTGSFGTAFIPGLIAVIVFALIILWRIRNTTAFLHQDTPLHDSTKQTLRIDTAMFGEPDILGSDQGFHQIRRKILIIHVNTIVFAMRIGSQRLSVRGDNLGSIFINRVLQLFHRRHITN